MNRQRSTWNQPGSDGAPRQAATSRRADIYTMNQEHPQPSPVEYENGDPDSWAETPTDNKNVSLDYEGDRVKRNEVGYGEIRKDVFDHKDSDQWNGKGKYDNAREASASRKASYTTHLARILLRTDNAKMIEDQSFDLMALPAKTIAATLDRLEKLSPDALPREQKVKRALACVKLAARMLDTEDESAIEKLGSAIMKIDDPTLKHILRTVAALTVAADDDDDDKGKSAGTDKSQEQQAAPAKTVSQSDKSQEQQAAPAKTVSQTEQQSQVQEQAQSQEQQSQQVQNCMTADDIQALDQMLSEEMSACGPAPMPVPAGPPPELTTLFQPPVPATPIAAAAARAEVASDIMFDDGDDEGEDPRVATTEATESAELTNLFADHPEVQAQREVVAAETEARVAAGGYGPNPTARTASSAKRIGQIQNPRGSGADDELGALWERPPVM